MIVLLFTLFLILLSYGILNNKPISKHDQNNFSILIACRNEEKHLPALFQALNKIDYPQDKYEIIIVDDASSDQSPVLLEKFCNENPNSRWLRLEEKDTEYKGKKAALKLATASAQFEFLLFTDADCVPPPNWLQSFNHYIDKKTGMIVAPVQIYNKKGINRISNLVNTGIYASTIGLGFPFSCAGGNLCVRKTAFNEVGGYDKIRHYISGDDKMLLNLIKRTNWKVRYNPEAIVMTFPVETTRKLDQKKRHYGKFGMSSLGYKIIQILVFIFFLYLPWNIIFQHNFLTLFTYTIGVSFFWLTLIFKLKIRFRIKDLLLALTLPYYMIYYSILALFTSWQWK